MNPESWVDVVLSGAATINLLQSNLWAAGVMRGEKAASGFDGPAESEDSNWIVLELNNNT